jgi:hypothetical protein
MRVVEVASNLCGRGRITLTPFTYDRDRAPRAKLRIRRRYRVDLILSLRERATKTPALMIKCAKRLNNEI